MIIIIIMIIIMIIIIIIIIILIIITTTRATTAIIIVDVQQGGCTFASSWKMNQNLPKNQFEQMISQQDVLRKKYATAGEWCRW